MAGPPSSLSLAARVAREPLARFLALGGLIFAVDRAIAGDAPDGGSAREIVIADDFVEGLREQQRARTGTLPDEAGTRALIDAFVREEVLHREARAAGLDVGDLVVRRRLVQKMEFALAASVDVPEPDDAALAAHLAAHADELRAPATTTLTHVFFARDRRGASLRADADAALAALRAEPAREQPEALGDPFLRGARLSAHTDTQLDAVFGEGAARSIADLELDRWSGAVESAYGLHVVRVDAREPARLPTVDEARERIARAVRERARAEALERAIEERIARYRVVRE